MIEQGDLALGYIHGGMGKEWKQIFSGDEGYKYGKGRK
jgi:hypothetical protein